MPQLVNVLETLFQWASQQPADNTTTVQFAMATNELTRNNLVTYTEGLLRYQPASSSGLFWFPPVFKSITSIPEYFSNRTYSLPGELLSAKPFNANNTDPIDVEIRAPWLFDANYQIFISSTKFSNANFNFGATFDSTTGVILGSHNSSLITKSVCQCSSSTPPK